MGGQRRTRPGPAGDEVLFRKWPSLRVVVVVVVKGFCHSRWRSARSLAPAFSHADTCIQVAWPIPTRTPNPADRPLTAFCGAPLEAMLPRRVPHLQMPIVAFTSGYDEPSPARPAAVPSPVPFRPIFKSDWDGLSSLDRSTGRPHVGWLAVVRPQTDHSDTVQIDNLHVTLYTVSFARQSWADLGVVVSSSPLFPPQVAKVNQLLSRSHNFRLFFSASALSMLGLGVVDNGQREG